MKNYKYFIFAVLVIGVGYLGFGITKKNLTGGGGGEAKPTVAPTAVPKPNYPTTLGSFLVTDKEVCLEDGKPLVYFFGFSSCSHCVWEKPVAKKVFDKFKNEIVYHENFDIETEMDVFEKYQDINPGYVPFLILGCKYARMGSGESLAATPEASKSLEEEALTAILCKLTDGKPNSVCAAIKDKVSDKEEKSIEGIKEDAIAKITDELSPTVSQKIKPQIEVTSVVVKEISNKYRYFFDIRNKGKNPFAGSVSISLYTPSMKLTEGTFDTGELNAGQLEPGLGMSRYIDMNTGTEEVHGEFGISRFSYKVFVEKEEVGAGQGNITSKLEVI